MNIQPPHAYLARTVVVIHYNVSNPDRPHTTAGVVTDVVSQGLVNGRGVTMVDARLQSSAPAYHDLSFLGIQLHQSFDAAVKSFTESKGAAQAYFP